MDTEREYYVFECPRCEQEMQVELQHAGMKIACPKCDTTFIPNQINKEQANIFPFNLKEVTHKEGITVEEKLLLEKVFDILAGVSFAAGIITLILMFMNVGEDNKILVFSYLTTTIMLAINIFLCLGLSELVKYFRFLCKDIFDIRNKEGDNE